MSGDGVAVNYAEKTTQELIELFRARDVNSKDFEQWLKGVIDQAAQFVGPPRRGPGIKRRRGAEEAPNLIDAKVKTKEEVAAPKPEASEPPNCHGAHANPEGLCAQGSAGGGSARTALQPGTAEAAEAASEQPPYLLLIDQVAYPCSILTLLSEGVCGRVECARVDGSGLGRARGHYSSFGLVALKSSSRANALTHEADVLVHLPTHPYIVEFLARGKQILHMYLH